MRDEVARHIFPMLRFIRRTFYLAVAGILCFAAFGIYCYLHVDSYHTTEDVSKIGTERHIALLLGTSNKLVGGAANPFYSARIESAVRLYKAGKISGIIASGDNRDRYYNEPARMKRDLVLAGVPENAILADPMGLRTYDSVIRCRDVFGVNNPIIISQDSHCKRALYIADSLGMEAVGFAAPTPTQSKFRVYNSAREFFARIMAVIDVNVTKGSVDVDELLKELKESKYFSDIASKFGK